jgi:hypothetical protein
MGHEMKSLIGLLRSLFDDLKRLHPEVRGLDRDLYTIEARFKDEGVGFLANALPSFGKSFDRGLADGRLTPPRGFRCGKGSVPLFLKGLLLQVFDTDGTLLVDPKVDAVKSLRQVFYLYKKLSPSDDLGFRLDRLTKRDFVATDSECDQPFDHTKIPLLRICFSYVLPNLDQFDFLKGKHGPGAVFEGLSSNQKWIELDRGISDYDRRLGLVGYDFGYCRDQYPASSKTFDTSEPELSARLVTVPKTHSSLRTITVEPCLNQFVQQALNSHLRHSIDACGILRNSLTLRDQSVNQKLALHGSLTGKYATIDLSKASDLLSLVLVKEAFRSKPRFLEACLLSRSPKVTVDGIDITLRKFAGMGNACTFPVQSVVFAVIAISAIMAVWGKTHYGAAKRASRLVHVYGDDIVVHTDYYSSVAEWLSSFGLRLNPLKTFSQGNFRESCGVDAYRGKNVSPVYIRHEPQVSSRDAKSIASLVASSNQLWSEGYYEASEYIRNNIGKVVSLPIVPSCSPALGWHTRRNATSISRWNRSLHRFEYESYTVSVKNRLDRLDGYAALDKFFHLRGDEPMDDEEHLERSSIKHKLVLKKRWVPSW